MYANSLWSHDMFYDPLDQAVRELCATNQQ